MELHQKRLSDKRYFKLEEDGIKFKIKTASEEIESKYRYEELGLEILRLKKKDGSWIFIVLTFILGHGLLYLLKEYEYQAESTLELILLITSAVLFFSMLIYMIFETRKSFVGINGGVKSISLLSDRPSEKEVNEFIKELHNRIRNKYIDFYVSPEDEKVDLESKLFQLKGLLDRGIINSVLFEEIKIKLTKNNNSIGFK